jgi:NADPH:quinone reductase-like Zn-dependent oxidoreductase
MATQENMNNIDDRFKMNAVIFEKYGSPDVLHIAEVEKPSNKDGEVLIRVHATSVTKYDCWVRSCSAPPGFNLLVRIISGRKPKHPILGTELSGEIAAVGKNVTRFKIGDQVYGYPGMNLGACAEYISLPEEAVALKPENLSYAESAAVLQGALTAFYFLRKANIQPGEKVLIFGASGGVGGYAVQLAKHHFGAEVTGVCSTQKMAYVKSLGADRVIDYSQEDFTENGQVYDVIFDTVGKTTVSRTKEVLKQDGWNLFATFGLPMLFQLLWLFKTSSQNLKFGALAETNDDLIFVTDLLETGVIKPSVDRCFPMERAAEAHCYVEEGHKLGNVVITIEPSI